MVSSYGSWTFITNHGAVLAVIAQHVQITAREIAAQLGITERSVHKIIAGLEAEGYVERRGNGRVNAHTVNHDLSLQGSERRDVSIGALLRVLVLDNGGETSNSLTVPEVDPGQELPEPGHKVRAEKVRVLPTEDCLSR